MAAKEAVFQVATLPGLCKKFALLLGAVQSYVHLNMVKVSRDTE